MGALPSDGAGRFGAILADPPWRFANRTGKMAPEHRRLSRYATMTLDEIAALPVAELALPRSHLYLWVPNALVLEGLEVLRRWGFTYKTNLVWYKTRKDGGPDGRGVGFYFRNVTELILFGTRGNLRTLAPGRRQVNILVSRKREHSRKPDDLYEIIESCSPGPYLELFARHCRPGWTQWGNEIDPAQLALAPLALDGPPPRERCAPGRDGREERARPDQLALNGHLAGEEHRDGD
ncbi:MAG TPA: MT-A70 family methyltransferase [Thermomicrobiales bacterium]|nr:MT-A70 family methyltransferase [Thermomicrobiales bacterium]